MDEFEIVGGSGGVLLCEEIFHLSANEMLAAGGGG